MSETQSQQDLMRRRAVLEVPGMEHVQVRRDLIYHEMEGAALTLDLYLPATAANAGSASAGNAARAGTASPPPPVVLLVHGGPIPPAAHRAIKNIGLFVSLGEILAASGIAAAVCGYFHHGWHDLDGSAANLAAAVRYLDEHRGALGIDASRLGLWFFSGGGVQLAPWLGQPSQPLQPSQPIQPAQPDPAVRCVVAYYPLLDLRGDLGPIAAFVPALPPAATLHRFSPAAVLADRAAKAPHVADVADIADISAGAAAAPLPPLLLARAGRDERYMLASLDTFVAAALAAGMELELHNHSAGRHGFDYLDDGPRSRAILHRTVEFLRQHLGVPAC